MKHFTAVLPVGGSKFEETQGGTHQYLILQDSQEARVLESTVMLASQPPASAGLSGAADQRNIEERSDVLIYSSDALDHRIEVSGPIEATLFVSSDVKGTDITAKVLDVYPDGTAYRVLRRARVMLATEP